MNDRLADWPPPPLLAQTGATRDNRWRMSIVEGSLVWMGNHKTYSIQRLDNLPGWPGERHPDGVAAGAPSDDGLQLAIRSGWLVNEHGEHNCGGSSSEWPYAHENYCGMDPLERLDDLPGWPEKETNDD